MLSCVFEPLVVLIAIGICRSSGRGIAKFPEPFDKLISLSVGTKFSERIFFVARDDHTGIPDLTAASCSAAPGRCRAGCIVPAENCEDGRDCSVEARRDNGRAHSHS